MPRVSDRQFLLNELDHMIKIWAIWDEEEDVEELLEVRAFMASCRYLVLRKHIRKNRSMIAYEGIRHKIVRNQYPVLTILVPKSILI